MSVFCGWISHHPHILYHTPLSERQASFLPKGRITHFIKQAWLTTLEDAARQHEQLTTWRPGDAIIHCCNEQSLHGALWSAGIPSCYLPHNAFLDEELFAIVPEANIEFDAVYNARFAPFKRHALARNIPHLLLLGTIVAEGDDAAYADRVKQELSHAVFSEDRFGRWLNERQVARAVSSAAVGLCLSQVEGAMYAAVEYLLCGRPIVSTANQGGRNEWLHADFCRIVATDPDSIARATLELAMENIPPEQIREQTLRQMTHYRRTFGELGQMIYDREQSGRDFLRDFYSTFHHKLGRWMSDKDFEQEVSAL